MLKTWRENIVPHKDVASGHYQQAEFAADLAEVLKGTAGPEYQDAIEFFNRTYLTEGMKMLLISALRRTEGINGEPVVQLKTAFGGGKTHTLLALYHMFRDPRSAKHEMVKKVMSLAKVKSIKKVNVAVLVGTDIDPVKPYTVPGSKIKINTLWGNMAYQLGGEKAFEQVADADKKGVSPGAATLVKIFNDTGPCVIIFDELIAYTRNIYNKNDLPCGSFDSILSFMQHLTEAVKRSKNCMVIASIPESEVEIGAQNGKEALVRIEKTFGRLEAIWKPVNADEGFEIVRRRLFEPVKDENIRDEVCRAFSDMYSKCQNDFPVGCKETDYLNRMRESYPIHPEVFDRLYSDWSTLEKFQRTRGVLRLMAAIIHELWIKNDSSLLIMPGNLPMDSQPVRNEMTKYLGDQWNSIVDSDVDGGRSEPKMIDSSNVRYGAISAARRVSRTIFLGSAPSSREQRNRGIESVRIMLGAVQPGESVSIFRDALSALSNKLTYLYDSGDRFWYDSHPNIKKTVEDRSARLTEEDAYSEIKRRMQTSREHGDFAGVHICPESADVGDEDEVRLVVLAPEHSYKKGTALSEALTSVRQILENRGNSPRLYKNMLLFLASDTDSLSNIEWDARSYISWKSILDERESLNLDAHQIRQANSSVGSLDSALNQKIHDAYCWLLVPNQTGTNPIEFTPVRISKGEGGFVSRASKTVKLEEILITRWTPAILQNELDKHLWKDNPHIGTKLLWEYFASNVYLPRLKNKDVLLACINEAVQSRDFFGYAMECDQNGKYLGFKFGAAFPNASIDAQSVLIKHDIATSVEVTLKPLEPPVIGPNVSQPPEIDPKGPKTTRFYGSIDANPIRLLEGIDKLDSEIIQHLIKNNAEIEITIEINAHLNQGISDQLKRILMENTKTLNFKTRNLE
ncbi:MAG: DUF499 domain-containing protein [Candidatus Micrarchaeota archaeon]|nr:DUF499 domain-containing protein [Candidatus Micrarchaeota archaeon]